MKHSTNFSYTKHLLKNKPTIIYIKILRLDRRGEYKSFFFLNIVKKREFTIAYTPQQNGVYERKNNTSIKDILTMLTSTKLPNYFWGEVLMIANYL